MSEEYSILKRIQGIIGQRLKVRGVILFGSRARGDFMPWSDYDVLIIADFKEPYLDRLAVVMDMLKDFPSSIEVHPYNLEEAIDMLRRGNPMIVDALEEGKLIYAGEGLEKLLCVYKELTMAGMKRSNTTIILPEGRSSDNHGSCEG